MNEKVYNTFLNFLKKNNFQRRINNLAKKYKGKNIILYSTGILSDVILDNFNLSDLNIIGVSDIKYQFQNNLDLTNYKGFKTIKPMDIRKNKPDLVLILMQEYFRAENYFRKELIPNHGKFKYDSLFKIPIIEFLIMKYKLPLKIIP